MNGATAILVNTNTVSLPADPFTTGIPYMPVSLAYLAAGLRKAGIEVRVIDAFGEAPERVHFREGFLVQGLLPEEVAALVPWNSSVIFVYAGTVAAHVATVAIISAIRARVRCPIVVVENTQAVTAYSLRPVAEEFFRAGADVILLGEGDVRGPQLVQSLARRGEIQAVPGLLFRRDGRVIDSGPPPQVADLESLPFPAWDLFPLHGYWRIHYAHGPMQGKYLSLLTSRGCPYPCQFCIIPALSAVRWRPRSARSVVDEMLAHVDLFGVREFHIEDLNPTVSERRVREFCREIIDRGIQVTWKIAAGTKIDTIKDPTTIGLMAQAGCRYLSLSPESGSPRMLKLMDKPFDHAHALRLVEEMARAGITSQACFVLGFPGEGANDRRLTREYVRQLVRAGLDEIALFIMTPVPGSATYGGLLGYRTLSELNFSPTWRSDYPPLSQFRLRLYGNFLLWKLRYRPWKILRQPLNFLRRNFETKMEMTPYRALRLTLLRLGSRLRPARPGTVSRERGL